MSDAPTPLVLTYALPAATAGSRQSARNGWLTFAVFLPALVAPFVHFTFDASPLQAVQMLWPSSPYQISDDLMLFLLGSGFFVSFPLAIWMLRRLLQPLPPGKIERIAGWVIGVVCLALVTAMLAMVSKNAIPSLDWPPDRNDAMLLGMLSGGFGLAGLGIWQAIRTRGQSRLAIQTLISSAYLANAWVCVIGFHEDPELGYWLTLPPAAAMLVGLIRRSFRRCNAL